ncbi:MAG TPA: hypothetical protein VGL69_12235 [Solirubrobacteraceae bacterium]|jgi:predicted enzyme related to lactoylglutathione lyase
MSHGEAVLYVQHLGPMTEFYERVFELQRAEHAQDFCELRSADWTLWLVSGTGTAAIDQTGVARRRSEVPIKLCFAVASIAAARAAMGGRGGRSSDRVWEFGGYLRTDIVDPEGNVVQLLAPVEPGPADLSDGPRR